jgi:hypothetical protein
VSGRYSDNFSDPNWWPTPPPKPLQAPSALKILLVVLLAAAVGGGIYASTRLSHSSSHTTTVPGTPDERQSMAQCLRSVGGGSGFEARTRFSGRGPSSTARQAFAVCRTLLQPDRRLPIAPQPTTTVAPAA